MLSIKDLLTKEIITMHTIPSNVVYGRAIFERDSVKIINQKEDMVEAWIGGLKGNMKEGGGSRRRVIFSIKKSELNWVCTGNPKNHQIFCKHCVALALAIQSNCSC
ncbi:hypothetical protein HC766_06000 [Candidatus Gracilibacteria bacterium]|nr:hypothetical protein [Candidatus Gracilibacteria bacterium]NJS41840.1 hypothetical protein [Candidatus Gracilibacteria bacterium]